MAPARSYLATPSTFWTPSLPVLERHVSVTPLDPLLWTLRLARLAWIAATLPLHILLILTLVVFPSATLPIHVPGRHRRWTLAQRLVYPVIGRLVWAIAGTGGGPPDFTPETERAIALSSRLVESLGALLGARRVRIWVDDVPPMQSRLADAWLRVGAIDPRGEIHPVTVPCFWLELEDGGTGSRRMARTGERVVLYFMGGGYTSGSPAEGNRCFELARETGLRIMGANYRKATHDGNAFPAALQDAIHAYAHLVGDLGYRDIVLAGDSAGGGLAMTLLLYLSTTLAQADSSPPSLVLPTHILLYSPWVDLTLSSYRSGFPPSYQDDFLNLTMLNYASQAYLVKTFSRSTDVPFLGLSPSEHEAHPFTLGAHHPFFSTSLPSAKPTLASINALYRDRGDLLKVLVISGSAEIFAPEIGALVRNLEEAAGSEDQDQGGGIQVEWLEEVDELHVFFMMPRWLSPAAGRAMQTVVRFLL